MKRVLIIDDDPEDAEILIEAFRQIDDGVHVEAISGCEEVSAISHALDFIFLDAHLPKISGRECLPAIRSHPLAASATVIIYTGFIDERTSNILLQSGADFILRKLADFEELKRELKQLCIETK